MSIPIQNLYYLLCYAWNRLEEAGIANVHPERLTKLVDLFGYVLANGTTHLLKRGLDRVYVPHHAELRGVRGKLDLALTVKRGLLAHNRTLCAFDELDYDAPHNRILKATLRTLTRVNGIDPALARRLASLHQRMSGVADVRVTRRDFRTVQLHRNNGFYDFLLHACRLVHDSVMIEEETGRAKFRSFIRDKRRMPLLFQKFVRNFLHREQRKYEVDARWIPWHDVEARTDDLPFLPRMETDVVLRSPERTLVIDTKFYRNALNERYGSATVRSPHLYQVLSYLRNLAPTLPPQHVLDGMLLYPAVGHPLDLRFRIGPHRIFVRTLNLSQPWPQIREDLLALVTEDVHLPALS